MTDTPPAGTLTRNAALASVSVALLLMSLKGYAAIETGSVAMLGSLADSGLDLIASLVTLYGVKLAAEPADTDHRFGHGKAEALAALFQVVLISVSAIGIAIRAVQRFIDGGGTGNAEYGIGVSVIAIVATLLLVAYQRRIVAQTRSVAIKADNVHYQSDLLLNGSVIAALMLDQYAGLHGADALFGIAIALWLGWGAYSASNQAIDQLMDREWDSERRMKLIRLAAGHPEAAGVHDLRTRTSGMQDFAQFHIWVAPDMTVREAHRVMDEIEVRLLKEFPGVEILIHVDPLGHVDPEIVD
jgi:ferrous-iron efflux pump FieF